MSDRPKIHHSDPRWKLAQESVDEYGSKVQEWVIIEDDGYEHHRIAVALALGEHLKPRAETG